MMRHITCPAANFIGGGACRQCGTRHKWARAVTPYIADTVPARDNPVTDETRYRNYTALLAAYRVRLLPRLSEAVEPGHALGREQQPRAHCRLLRWQVRARRPSHTGTRLHERTNSECRDQIVSRRSRRIC